MRSNKQIRYKFRRKKMKKGDDDEINRKIDAKTSGDRKARALSKKEHYKRIRQK